MPPISKTKKLSSTERVMAQHVDPIEEAEKQVVYWLRTYREALREYWRWERRLQDAKTAKALEEEAKKE